MRSSQFAARRRSPMDYSQTRAAHPSIGRNATPTSSSCSCGGTCPKCASQTLSLATHADQESPAIPSAKLQILGELQTPTDSSHESTASGDATDQMSDGIETSPSDEAEALGGNAACPVNAVFSSNVAGGGKANCQVPKGMSGASRLAEYIVRGAGTIPTGGLSISEQFSVIDDPYSVFAALKPVTNTTDSSGKFNDCYILATKTNLPPDFQLKVMQNHLYNGQPISKNIITYTATGVGVRHCKRKQGSCDFSDVCRLG